MANRFDDVIIEAILCSNHTDGSDVDEIVAYIEKKCGTIPNSEVVRLALTNLVSNGKLQRLAHGYRIKTPAPKEKISMEEAEEIAHLIAEAVNRDYEAIDAYSKLSQEARLTALKERAQGQHMGFEKKENWVKELGQRVKKGCYVNGVWQGNGAVVSTVNPADNKPIDKVAVASIQDYEEGMQACALAAKIWKQMPAPGRGAIVREIGDSLRTKIRDLGRIVSLEMGKVLAEAIGEVQEMVDMCDFAVGLSRQLNELVTPSKRPNPMMLEMWSPLGIVGVVTAFDFPCAVLRKAFIALVCGDCVVWKGAPTTPLVTIAITNIIGGVLKKSKLPGAIFTSFCGGAEIGQAIAKDPRIPLVYFIGSSQVGLKVKQTVNQRYGKCLLELSGNSAIIVMDDADIKLVIRSIVFPAGGTAGQRSTTCRRLLLHENIYQKVLEELVDVYRQVKVGNPLDKDTLIGPLHTRASRDNFAKQIEIIKSQGGKIVVGGAIIELEGNYVQPTVVEISTSAEVVKEDFFGPVVYVMKFKTLNEAIEITNSLPQGLNSSIFTCRPALIFKSIWPQGIDCDIPTNRVEIGGSFDDGKVGSDSWKQYMRRSTCTINSGSELRLAQRINFG